ncbi:MULTISPECIES: ABC-three component system middle component 2 [Helcococcus]|uniref:ABC-three component system middle component 2 n=1 Tax=Helcococcus bovis TaxID=3153252 RepID=A0ABW9F5L2_9FIRM
MSSLFNSVYEISLRMLIQLFVLNREARTSDYISCIDYLSLYSKSFKFGNYDLHGQKPYRFSELASRIKLGKKALKLLVSKGYASVSAENQGFIFQITDSGKQVVDSLKLEYAMIYTELAIETQEHFKEYSDSEILKYINGISRERSL